MFDSGTVSGIAACSTMTATVAGCTVFKSRTEEWGGGIVQEIDAAAMSLWIKGPSNLDVSCVRHAADGIANVAHHVRRHRRPR